MGEGELIAAIIQQAIIDSNVDTAKIINNSNRMEAEANKESAKKWLASNSEDKMSLNWYCSFVHIDPDWVRRKARQNGATPDSQQPTVNGHL